METDICTCTKTKADHDNALVTGACLTFTLDRKATYWAERREKERAKKEQFLADIKSGRLVPRKPLPCDVPEPTAGAREARKADMLAQLAAMGGNATADAPHALDAADAPQHSGGL